MRTLLTRISLLAALGGMALGAVPRAAVPHCQSGAGTPSHEAAHHQHAPAKDTGSAEQCPHCPPADCRRHVECAVAADLAVLSDAAPPAAAPAAGAPEAPMVLGVSRIAQPPTPPPQLLG
ncbi:MAG: hypothetical protein AB7L66_00165 [Gemmatimonadales bacterium]